jgi:deoxyribodipyrimidine photo-lyase
LASAIEKLGGRLILRRGSAAEELAALVTVTGARTVHFTRRYEDWAVAQEYAVKQAVEAAGGSVRRFGGNLLFEPDSIRSKEDKPYRVFSPFWRACLAAPPPRQPLQAPRTIPAPNAVPRSDKLEDWGLLPTRPDWAGGLRTTWTPGEAGARERLDDFFEDRLARYAAQRDEPAAEASSRLSPHLHFGEISPHQAYWAASFAADAEPRLQRTAAKFASEIGWREFSYHLLAQVPDLAVAPLRPEFRDFPWTSDRSHLAAWQRGATGYPLVDAGMRELWQTGWMHNRVRMVAASFLVKHLLIPWQEGEAWFWDTLVDADAANNAASWQWVAGCGADAAPYFRIFNPVMQSAKFDSEGAYVRRYVPELAKLPDAHVHAPWEAPDDLLAAAGVELGVTYPRPIVDHKVARDRALAAYAMIQQAR